VQAIYQDYDLEMAVKMVEKMVKEAEDDILLKSYIPGIKKQAYLLIFQTKCKLFRTIDLAELEKLLGSATPKDEAIQSIEGFLSVDGFDTIFDKKSNTLSCVVKRKFDCDQVVQ